MKSQSPSTIFKITSKHCSPLRITAIEFTFIQPWNIKQSQAKNGNLNEDMTWLHGGFHYLRGRSNYYTKYDIHCHMEFYVTTATFWMTLLKNKWTYIVTDDGWVGQNPTFSCQQLMKLDCWDLDGNSLGKWQFLQTMQIIQKIFKEWQIMLD